MSNKKRFDKLSKMSEKINEISDVNDITIKDWKSIVQENIKMLSRLKREHIFNLVLNVIQAICYTILIICFGVFIATAIIRTKTFNETIQQYNECVEVNNKEYCRIEEK